MSFIDFKEVTSNNAGTTTRYGGNDLKEIMQILNNKVVATRRISIKNPFRFTEFFDLNPAASGVPAPPSETNTSRIYVDTTDSKVKIKKTAGTVLDIENVNIPSSALNQITDKAKLPSSGVYNDQNNSMGAFYSDWTQITAPTNPASGTRRMFVSSVTGQLSVLSSTGTIVSVENTGGGGDVFLNQSNTHGDLDNIFRSSRLILRNPANTFSYLLAGSAIVANRTVTLPLLTGNDTVAMEAFAATFTNKTINATNNSITDTSIAAGDILKSSGTKFVRMARGTALQVLRTNSGGTDLEWSTPTAGGDVGSAQSNTFGDFDQIFRSGRLDVRNPANTFSYSITGSAIAADRAVTLPLLTAGDTFLMEAFAATMTNKTINTTDNTVTATSQATGDLLKNNGTKFVRMARGTSLQVLRTNSGATDLEFASLDSERVGKHQANGNGSTTVFNIAHGLGSTPTYAFVSVGQSGTTNPQINRSYTVDATNIIVTFASAPSSGTNNVVIYWRVVA